MNSPNDYDSRDSDSTPSQGELNSRENSSQVANLKKESPSSSERKLKSRSKSTSGRSAMTTREERGKPSREKIAPSSTGRHSLQDAVEVETCHATSSEQSRSMHLTKTAVSLCSLFDYQKLFQLTNARILSIEFPGGISLSLSPDKVIDELWSSRSRCLEASALMVTAAGYQRREEVLGEPFGIVFPPHATNFDIIRKWIETGFTSLPLESIEHEGETYRVFETNIYADIQENLLLQMWLVQKDITANSKALSAARMAEQHYRTLVERPGFILVRVKPNGEILYITPEVEETVGYSATEFQSNPNLIRQLLHPEDFNRHDTLIQARKDRTTKTTEVEYRVRHRDGSYHWFYERQIPKLNELGIIEYYDSIVLDIQERKQLESSLMHAQRMETLGTLAGGIAHDFNNHLAAILGQLSMCLQEVSPTAPSYSRLASAEQAALCCTEMAKYLLSFGQQEEMKRELVDIASCLEETVLLITHVLPSSIETKLHSQLSFSTAKASYTHLQQVVMNLAVNARDAMEGSGELTISARNISILPEQRTLNYPRITPGDYIEIEIQDTGCGIPAAHLEHVFDPFFTTKRKESSTGLGLCTVYSIIQGLDGMIHVESEPDKGTTFRFILPQSKKSAKQKKPSNPENAPRGDETILVADDDAMVLQMVSSALEMHGYTVICAQDGEEAVRLFREAQHQVSLALIDQTMPKLTGREVILDLCELRKDLPIILTSGYGNEHFEVPLNKELSHFMSKPYHLPKLLKMIRDLLDST